MPQSPTHAHRPGLSTDTLDWTLVQAQQLVKHQQVIQIEATTPIEEACMVLIENGISSAPIYDPATHTYVGMFDYRDIISFLLLVLDRSPSETRASLEIKSLIRNASLLRQVPVQMAADLSTQNPFYAIVPETTLSHVVAIFGYGTHRMAVVDERGHIEGILSQSTVNQYLHQNLEKFPQLHQLTLRSLQDLKLAETSVYTVPANSLVLDAMKAMVDLSVTSLAVVDNEENAGLLGNISLTDIKYIMKKRRHELLWATCLDLIRHARLEQGLEDGQDRATVFSVTPSTTLQHCIALLAATRAHRLWVTGGHSNSATTTISVAQPTAPAASPVKRGLSPLNPGSGSDSKSNLSGTTSGPSSLPSHMRHPSSGGVTAPFINSGRVIGVVSLTDILRVITPSDD
ncbi:cell separation during budding [Dispira parvispora]|uniref:Cell separation during budding n=1 Tax=Dispira parvispora TaxID=1520584 RepID=A0A9W8E5M6_9FUNG|nr:cell separation during budding [Dispira parvispora]